MTAAVRATSKHLAEVAAQLDDRERQMIASLAALRLATTSHLQRLHFARGAADRRAAQRALAKLTRLGVVVRLARRIGGMRAGSAGQIYALGVVGQHLAGVGVAAGSGRRRPWTPSLPFTEHRLAITELYVGLVEAARAGKLELVGFVAEPAAWRSYSGPHGGRSWLKPDAYAVTAGRDYEDHWFIEIDCATESPLVLQRKARRYLAYQASGREQATRGVFPLVLFVVPDAARQQVVERTIRLLAETDRRLFRVTLATHAVEALAGGSA